MVGKLSRLDLGQAEGVRSLTGFWAVFGHSHAGFRLFFPPQSLPRGPIDTQMCVPHFCPFYREKKRPVSEKASVSTCFHQRLDSFQNYSPVAGNCAPVAVVISVPLDFLART